MRKIKILYVEDEVFLGKIVKESLESRNYEVCMESDGAKAFELFKQFTPDVCILDVMLPHRDGFEIAEDIRTVNTDVPLIFLTAKTQVEDLVKGFKIGGNDYIRKPFSMEELIVRIDNALNRKKDSTDSINQEILQVGNFQYHIHRQILVINGVEQKLSYRESELLKILFENRDRIIDRREILNLLWGNDNFFNSRNLDVYITKLRGYLKEDPKLEILTIKGIGYRFIVQ